MALDFWLVSIWMTIFLDEVSTSYMPGMFAKKFDQGSILEKF